MSTFNPDAPVENPGGFIQHTYQQPTNDMFYWSGAVGGMNPNPGFNDGSRRNIPSPVNPFAQFGQVNTQPQAIPEQAVQPFSSYPPATPSTFNPTPAVPNMGLNSMVESRRNMPSTQVNNNNPWAPQPQQVPQYPVNDQPSMFGPGYPQFNGWNSMNPGPGYKVEMNTMALYNTTGNSVGFDKRNSWDNCYTHNRPIVPPVINWNAGNEQPSYPGYAAYSQPQVSYPVAQTPTSQMTWKDIADNNWKGANL